MWWGTTGGCYVCVCVETLLRASELPNRVSQGEFRTPAAAALRAVTAGAPAATAAAGRLGDGPGAGGPQLQEAR